MTPDSSLPAPNSPDWLLRLEAEYRGKKINNLEGHRLLAALGRALATYPDSQRAQIASYAGFLPRDIARALHPLMRLGARSPKHDTDLVVDAIEANRHHVVALLSILDGLPTSARERLTASIAAHINANCHGQALDRALNSITQARLETPEEERAQVLRYMHLVGLGGRCTWTAFVSACRALQQERPLVLFMCPDYSYTLRNDGAVEYTLDNLGDGPGLTALKGLPIIAIMIADAARRRTGLPMRVILGWADFEANEANARLCNVHGGVIEFHRRCRAGAEAALAVLRSYLPRDLSELRRKSSESGTTVVFGAANRTVVTVDLLPITHLAGLSSRDALQNVLATERDECVASCASPSGRRRIDALLRVRASVLSRWTDDHAPPEYWTHLHQRRDPARVMDSALAAEASDPASQRLLDYLRGRLIAHGAEYRWLHKLVSAMQPALHVVADAPAMWQAFSLGLPKVRRAYVPTTYLGASMLATPFDSPVAPLEVAPGVIVRCFGVGAPTKIAHVTFKDGARYPAPGHVAANRNRSEHITVVRGQLTASTLHATTAIGVGESCELRVGLPYVITGSGECIDIVLDGPGGTTELIDDKHD